MGVVLSTGLLVGVVGGKVVAGRTVVLCFGSPVVVVSGKVVAEWTVVIYFGSPVVVVGGKVVAWWTVVISSGAPIVVVGGKLVDGWQTLSTQNAGAVHGDDVVVLMELRVGDEEFAMHVYAPSQAVQELPTYNRISLVVQANSS